MYGADAALHHSPPAVADDALGVVVRMGNDRPWSSSRSSASVLHQSAGSLSSSCSPARSSARDEPRAAVRTSGLTEAATTERRAMSELARQIDDTELADRIRAGDREALGAFYDRYAAVATGVALRVVRDHAQAEDVVHDAFVTVWQQIGRFDRSRGSPRAWLLTIVRNRAIDRLRATRPSIETGVADELSLLRTGVNPTWDDAIERLSAEQLRMAVAQLPHEQRTAVELAYFGGHTYREIAEITGVPNGTASGRLRLALAKLRDSLSPTDAAPLSVSARRTATLELDR
jgi:RNA polymerase sigma-70 factor (ECF subfamily)